MRFLFKLILAGIVASLIASVVVYQLEYNGVNTEKTLIPKLLAQGYTFETPSQYFKESSHPNKTALLIHDADNSVIEGLKAFMKEETELGVKSAFYPRLKLFGLEDNWTRVPDDSFYWLLTAQTEGFEVGYQQECLTHNNGNTTAATIEFKENLELLQSAFRITTTSYHGDVSKPKINNFDLYNATLWHSLNLNEVYTLLPNASYISDSNMRLTQTKTLGNLVIIQLHTDWAR